LRQWVDGAAPVDQETEHHRGMLQNATEKGLQALQAAWQATPSRVRQTLGRPFLEQLKAAAAEYDTLRGGANQVPDAVASLNEGVF
jgi:hypothetical protein